VIGHRRGSGSGVDLNPPHELGPIGMGKRVGPRGFLAVHISRANRQKLGSALALLFALTLSVGVLLVPREYPGRAAVGYVGVFFAALLSAASLFVPGPSMVAAFTAGAVLNPFAVGLVAALGSTLGEITGYYVGAGGRLLLKESRLRHAQHLMERYGSSAVFVLAAVPNFLFDAVGMVAGLGRFPLWKFLTATFLGKAIRFCLTAYLGDRFISEPVGIQPSTLSGALQEVLCVLTT